MVTFNVDNVVKQKRIVSKALAMTGADLMLLQETKVDQIWAAEVSKDFKDYKFILNAEDSYIKDFEDKIHKTSKPRQAGTGALINEDTASEASYKFSHTHRFHEIALPGLMVINVYLPSDGEGVVKQEDFRQCMSDLSEYIEDNCGSREILLTGDFNTSKRQQKKARWQSLEALMSRHNLEATVPGFTTNYNPNNCETTLDFAVTSKVKG